MHHNSHFMYAFPQLSILLMIILLSKIERRYLCVTPGTSRGKRPCTLVSYGTAKYDFHMLYNILFGI
jgi:hypothetical protein